MSTLLRRSRLTDRSGDSDLIRSESCIYRACHDSRRVRCARTHVHARAYVGSMRGQRWLSPTRAHNHAEKNRSRSPSPSRRSQRRASLIFRRRGVQWRITRGVLDTTAERNVCRWLDRARLFKNGGRVVFRHYLRLLQ